MSWKQVNTIAPYIFRDVAPPHDERIAHVEHENQGVSLHVPGYGTYDTNPNCGPVVLLEMRNNVPYVVIWGDITRDAPTHEINLAGAAESLRLPENGD